MVAGGRKTTGAGSHPAPVAAARQAWIFCSADTRLDLSGTAGTEERVRSGSDIVADVRFGPARSRADIAREGEI